MCGINGIIFKKSKTDFSKIIKMNALLDHRGPDDRGFINHKIFYLVILGCLSSIRQILAHNLCL